MRLLAWRVENAGSIFLGKYAPKRQAIMPAGPITFCRLEDLRLHNPDLSVKDFIKTPTVQSLSEEGLRQIAPTIIALAEAEGLAGHARIDQSEDEMLTPKESIQEMEPYSGPGVGRMDSLRLDFNENLLGASPKCH